MSGSPFVLAPDEEVEITIRYEPEAAGQATATLQLTGGGGATVELSGSATGESGDVLLDEDLADGLSSDWSSPTPSAWTAANGLLEQVQYSPGVHRRITYLPGSSWTDYRVEVSMHGTGWYHYCSAQQLAFRYVDEANHYMIQPHSDGTVALFRYVGGNGTLVHSHSLGQSAVYAGGRYAVEVVGAEISVFKDGQLLFSVTDGALAVGTIGLQSIHIRGLFDDVLVKRRLLGRPLRGLEQSGTLGMDGQRRSARASCLRGRWAAPDHVYAGRVMDQLPRRGDDAG